MKYNTKVFAAVFLSLQLLIVFGFIGYSLTIDSLIEKYGREYKINVEEIYGVRFGVCSFNLSYDYYGFYDKAYIVPDKDGMYKIRDDYNANEKAVSYFYCSDYESFPKNQEYTLKYNTEYSCDSFDCNHSYLVVKVLFGKCVAEEFYCNGVPIEEYVLNPSAYDLWKY